MAFTILTTTGPVISAKISGELHHVVGALRPEGYQPPISGLTKLSFAAQFIKLLSLRKTRIAGSVLARPYLRKARIVSNA